ncbi:cobalamin B12-binding domain-containing protein [Methylobacterium sp. P5_C11]
MQNIASSEGHWGENSPPETERAAEARQLYARKRAAEAARERCLVLGQVVQAEILPQLMLLHRGFVSAETKPVFKPNVEQVAAFTNLALAAEDAPIIEAFTALMAKGHPLDRLFIDLLAPAAALLGRMWDDDLCDFVEVTTGVARLQNLIARFRVDGDAVQLDGKRRLLLMSAPGEEHTFGVRIVEQFLRRAEWFVSIGLSSRPDEIADLVASEWFAVVGLTLSNETRLEPLARAIRSVRQASCNRAIGVMVGGPVFLKRPALVEQVGADASAVDAATAVLLAQRLLEFGTDIAKRA